MSKLYLNKNKIHRDNSRFFKLFNCAPYVNFSFPFAYLATFVSFQVTKLTMKLSRKRALCIY